MIILKHPAEQLSTEEQNKKKEKTLDEFQRIEVQNLKNALKTLE